MIGSIVIGLIGYSLCLLYAGAGFKTIAKRNRTAGDIYFGTLMVCIAALFAAVIKRLTGV